LVVRPEGKRPLGRPRRIWEDDISVVEIIEIVWKMCTVFIWLRIGPSGGPL
jgi:hypothetical protein